MINPNELTQIDLDTLAPNDSFGFWNCLKWKKRVDLHVFSHWLFDSLLLLLTFEDDWAAVINHLLSWFTNAIIHFLKSLNSDDQTFVKAMNFPVSTLWFRSSLLPTSLQWWKPLLQTFITIQMLHTMFPFNTSSMGSKTWSDTFSSLSPLRIPLILLSAFSGVTSVFFSKRYLDHFCLKIAQADSIGFKTPIWNDWLVK